MKLAVERQLEIQTLHFDHRQDDNLRQYMS